MYAITVHNNSTFKPLMWSLTNDRMKIFFERKGRKFEIKSLHNKSDEVSRLSDFDNIDAELKIIKSLEMML